MAFLALKYHTPLRHPQVLERLGIDFIPSFEIHLFSACEV